MKKVFISGGASGLGKILTESISKRNDCIIEFTYCSSEESAKKIVSNNSNCRAHHCDFSDHDSLEKLCNYLQSNNFDILINNALVSYNQERFHKLDSNEILSSFNINVLSWIKITQALIRGFIKRKSGKIINILSNAVLNEPPLGYSLYTAEKSYLLSLSKSWSVEYVKRGITSNSISPSFMYTNLHHKLDSRVVENLTKSHPLGKLLEPTDIIPSIHFLIDAPAHYNGINIPINTIEKIL